MLYSGLKLKSNFELAGNYHNFLGTKRLLPRFDSESLPGNSFVMQNIQSHIGQFIPQKGAFGYLGERKS